MKRVVMAIFDGVQALDVAGPLDVFAEANALMGAGPGYSIATASPGGAPVRATNGLRLLADLSLEDATGPWDVALVAGGPALSTGRVDEAIVRWLRDVAAHQASYGSICTGAFALGAAGLLEGRAVTTHWNSSASLARRFPGARVEADRLFCRDGPLITSAGITAGIDLALAMVAEDFGRDLSLAVAKKLVVFAQRQGGQSQFSPYLVASADPADPMGKVLAHVMAHLRDDLSVARLAEVAGMSARNFARVFVDWAQATPGEFVERARVDVARRMLESTTQPLKTVAWDCGFASADRMRLVFTKRLGVTPVQYRASFAR